MILLVAIIGLALSVLALCDRRARPFVCVVALTWFMTTLADMNPDRLEALSLRIPVDLLGGALAAFVLIVTRERRFWFVAGVSVFSIMLLNHAAFWLARWNGVDAWFVYANALNALFLFQLGLFAMPGIGRCVTTCRAWLGALVRRRGGWSGLGVGEAWSPNRLHAVSNTFGDRRAYGGTDCSVQISSDKG